MYFTFFVIPKTYKKLKNRQPITIHRFLYFWVTREKITIVYYNFTSSPNLEMLRNVF